MYSNKETDGVFLLPKKVLKYMNNAKKSELKLLLLLFSDMENFSVEKASDILGETPDSIMSALSFWRGTGLICENDEDEKKEISFAEVKEDISAKAETENRSESEKETSSPTDKGYSLVEIADARKNDKDFSYLVDFVEKTTGELMNSAKQGDLLYLYDSLNMPCDVIMGITAHCVNEGKTKIRYIVKAAEGIYNDGVRNYEELESYLNAKNKYKEFSTFVKKLIGAEGRAFTPAEEKTVKKWESEMCVSRELVEYAYERTVTLIAKPSLPYMGKILEGWHADGITTLEKAKEQVEKNKSAVAKKTPSSERVQKSGLDVNLDDIFEKP